MENTLGITISLIVNGEEIAQRSAESFEIAEQCLGSLERQYNKMDSDLAAISEDNN